MKPDGVCNGMVSASGEHFDIEIPAFSLDSGNAKPTIN